MRSEGHRANILSRGFRLVAVGARRDGDGTWYAAQVFGRRCPHWPVAPSVTSRSRSRCPQCRAVSSIMCTSA